MKYRITARNRPKDPESLGNRNRDRVIAEGETKDIGLSWSGSGPNWDEHFTVTFPGEKQRVRITLSREQAERIVGYVRGRIAHQERNNAAR